MGKTVRKAKPRRKLSTVKMIDISTGHITQMDSELLGSDEVKEGCGPFVVYPYDYGWFIPTPPRNKNWGEEVREIEWFGFSPAFRDLIIRCQDEGVDMIRLDQDADHIDDLMRFEW